MDSLYILILYLIAIFIWLFPPIMQYGERYFYFFLILAISDLIVLTSIKFRIIDASYIYIFINYFAYLTILSKRVLNKYWYIFLILFLIAVTYVFSYNNLLIRNLIFITISIFIFLKILFSFITEVVTTKIIKIFLTVFLLYELTVIIKFVNLIIGLTNAFSYFLVTTIFEILFGLFFSLFKEDSQRIVIKLRQTQ